MGTCLVMTSSSAGVEGPASQAPVPAHHAAHVQKFWKVSSGAAWELESAHESAART